MSKPPQPRRHGFVAIGPSFYVWEERRVDAIRSARDLLGRPGATPVAVLPAVSQASRRR